jgi:2-polyprenyl-3-methyl-5-hydroxy-6-metoxy-1,4-benzoquinol methylase
MHAEAMIRDTFESLSNPEPDIASWLDRLDENLHYGRAWHRYRYVYRTGGPGGLRILDAGSDVGQASLEAARLNPGATVIGIDASSDVLEVARQRAEAVALSQAVDFRTHDPAQPLPESWGQFDLIVCRGGLARADDPAGMLARLARSLEPDGLIHLTLPSRSGQAAARSLRQAIDILLPVPVGDATDRVKAACELIEALRADHPIRAWIAEAAQEADLVQFVAETLAARRDWTLDEGIDLLGRAGLRLLYVATAWRWRPDRVFSANGLDGLGDRLDQLSPDSLGRLVDALDPSMLDGQYRLFACHENFEPPTPAWPAARRDDPRQFDRLVPHLTGLMPPSSTLRPGAGGRSIYRTVSGALGELDRWSSLLLGLVDGTATCGAIEQALASRTRGGDDAEVRQQRWIDLADCGLILLEPPSSR